MIMDTVFTQNIARARRLPVVAMTALLAVVSTLGLMQKPADAGVSINIGTPGTYIQYNDWRYHHDRAYHDRYDRWRRDHHDRHH
jgi:hypothetical protein